MPYTASENCTEASVHMDFVRGLAAIAVMLGHSRDLFFSSLNGHNPASLSHGAANLHPSQITIGNEAVMVFFVLSGYLVGGSVLRSRGKWSWKSYLTMRLTRLWVVLLPALVLTLALDLAGLSLFPQSTSIYQGPVGQSEVRANLIHTLTPTVLAGNALFLQTVLVPTAGSNIALWSLSNEFWYYLAFPLLVFALLPNGLRGSIPRRAAYVCAAVGGFFILGLDGTILFVPWLLGASISILPKRLGHRASFLLLVCAGILQIPLMALVRRMPLDLHLAQMCTALSFGALLYVISNRRGPIQSRFYRRMATGLSDLSYPLYLVHLPILVFLCASINRPWHQWAKTPVHIAVVLGMNAIAIVVAFLFHACFQRHTASVRAVAWKIFATAQPSPSIAKVSPCIEPFVTRRLGESSQH